MTCTWVRPLLKNQCTDHELMSSFFYGAIACVSPRIRAPHAPAIARKSPVLQSHRFSMETLPSSVPTLPCSSERK